MATKKAVPIIAASFLVGVFCSSLGWSFYFVISGAVFLAGVSLFWDKDKIRIIKIATILIITLALGYFYFSFYNNFKSQREKINFGSKVELFAVISNSPQPSEEYQVFEAKLKGPNRGKIRVFTGTPSLFEYGDLIKIKGKIERNLAGHLPPVSFFPEVELIAPNHGSWIKSQLLKFKEKQIEVFRKFLPKNEAALLSGITLGYRADFSSDLKNKMSKSGTTHIVALSGYNIAILVLAIERALSPILSRRKRFYVVLGIIFLFVLMVGGEASVVRAAIMGILVLFAKEIGRPSEVSRIIILTALAMVLWDPNLLKFNIGFQLSFLSLAGIIYLEPIISNYLKINKRSASFMSWKENAITTFSAQVFVSPVIIQTFGQFSLTSIIANVLILEFVPVAIFFGFILAGLGLLSPFLAFVISKITLLLLAYQIAVIRVFSFLKVSIPNVFASTFFYGIYYSGLIFIILKNRFQTKNNLEFKISHQNN